MWSVVALGSRVAFASGRPSRSRSWRSSSTMRSSPSPSPHDRNGSRQGLVGFIGLGNMGYCMAKNLARDGHGVVLFDADFSKANALAAETGATTTVSLEEVARMSSSIITMLPNTPNVEDVYLGQYDGPRGGNEKGTPQSTAAATRDAQRGRGLLDLVQPGTILVDSSSIDPLVSQRVNAIAARKGIIMVDAPVSGGVPAAADGTLTFICGGTHDGVERARPLLMSMGSTVVHCGGAGTGCIAKVCNNLSLAISMIGVAEAMSLGSKLGMDPKVLANVLNSSTARCWSSEAYNPCPGVMEGVPASRDFQGGFAASFMEKDLHLALKTARQSSQLLPMGAHAHQLYALLCNQGGAHKDFSSIYELVSK